MGAVARLLVAVGSLAALAVVLAGLVVAWRVGRSLRRRSRERRAASVRPALLAVAVADADEPAESELAVLAALDPRTWRAVEPQVLALLGKLQGSAHASLVDLLHRRGTEAAAVAMTRSRRARRRALGATRLGILGSGEPVTELLPLLDDPHSDVRRAAAWALSRSERGNAAAGALLACVAARRGLPRGLVGEALLALGPAAAPALLAALDDPCPAVVVTAAEVLGHQRVLAAGRPLLRVLRDGPGEARAAAAQALGRLGTPSAVGPLVAAAAAGADQPAGVRCEALTALGAIGDPVAVRPIGEIVATGGPLRVAAAAAAALACLGEAGMRSLEALGAGGGPGAPHAQEALAVAELARGRAAGRAVAAAGRSARESMA